MPTIYKLNPKEVTDLEVKNDNLFAAKHLVHSLVPSTMIFGCDNGNPVDKDILYCDGVIYTDSIYAAARQDFGGGAYNLKVVIRALTDIRRIHEEWLKSNQTT